MQRAFKAITQLHRIAEVPGARRLTPDWPKLLAAYLGFPLPRLPFSIRCGGSTFEFRELSDIPTFWQIFVVHIYPVRATDRLIIDVGANVGAFTLYALLHAPAAHVIAIEPAPDSVERLRTLLGDHGLLSRCTIMQAALAAEAGTTTIELSPSSQLRVTGRGGLMVPTITLDRLVNDYREVDLLKIDAEGAEFQAFPNTGAAALARIARIEMEYHPCGDRQALFHYLQKQGFDLTLQEDNPGEHGYGMASLVRRRGDGSLASLAGSC